MEYRITSRVGLWSLFAMGILMLRAQETQAANILGMFPMSAASHNNVFKALTQELAARGHRLTVVTPLPINNPPANYTQIDVSKAANPHFSAFGTIGVMRMVEAYLKILNVTSNICNDVLETPEMRKLMDPKASGQKFDVMLISHFFSECYYPFAHIYDVPVITISPAGSFPITDNMVGNIALPSFVPNTFFSFTDRMNFFERTVNLVSYVAVNLFTKFYMVPEYEKIARGHFGDIPPLPEILKRTKLVFLNNHFTYNYPRPLTPNIVEIGGIHVKSPKPLPKDLQKFMDEAKDGVIYFSMGSNLKAAYFPTEVINTLMSVFSQLRQRVLMKFEGDAPIPGQPPNVRLEKWLPQNDLLAHPNMKLFITHGGLLSFQEAVARGVPLIGIPFYGDQEMNLQKVLRLGVGLRVAYSELTKDNLMQPIKKILGDSSYQNRMKELSAQAMDQLEHPLQKAVFWTEYIIRHKGAKHIQPASLELGWCQLYMVDVISFLLFVPLLLMLVLYRLMLKCCCRRKTVVKKPQTKTKDKRH